MIQLGVIIFFIVLIVLMPKNNKEEVKAAHLLIDKYAIPVVKKRNPVRQLALLEKELGVSVYRASRKKTFIIIGAFFGLMLLFGLLIYFLVENEQFVAIIVVGIIAFLVLIAGTIVMWVIAIRQASSLRTDAWARILNEIDPTFPIEFLNDRKWQKAFLAQMESMDRELAQ